MERVSVGVIGGGFAGGTLVRNLRRVHGVRVEVAGIAASSFDSAARFAAHHDIPRAYRSYADLLESDVDVVVVAVPNRLHEQVVIDAAVAGKHVICEKPLTGAFGVPGSGVPRAEQEWATVRASVDRVESALARSQVTFMYAENWVYAPAVTRIKGLLEAAGGSTLDLRAEASHSGSHAAPNRRRASAGGGALITLGAHPISTVLHLKAFESGLAGGEPVVVESVIADVASLHESPAFNLGAPHRWLVRECEDVETWANLVLRFSDGSRAVVTASFAMLGGIHNRLEVYTTNAAYRSSITGGNDLLAFTPDAGAFGSELLPEKLESSTGWVPMSPDEDFSRGFPHEMQDFIEAVVQGRPPLSGFSLARDTLDVIYAGYLSAARGERVEMPNPGVVRHGDPD